MGDLLIGTASWTDKSLIASGWYPKGASSAEERLKYYASQFPVVEVDSTYYFMPSEENSRRWVERTPDGFTFNIKAFSILTGHPTKENALPKEIARPEKKNVYPKDLDGAAIDEIWDRFLSALDPLRQAGKLGCLLFQFPPWFVIGRKSKDYVLQCAKRAAPVPICVEFRHETWMREDNRDETLDFLEGHAIPYVCVDMPQGFRSSIPPVVAATAELAVVRFHGRNADEWESGSVQRRFRYLYKRDELEDWVPRIRSLREEAATTHVLMNNCYRDYAQVNAKQLSDLLTR
jgi:uncharacterized protein YecE (DUF72 family)